MHSLKKSASIILISILAVFSAELIFREIYELRFDKISDSLIFISAFIISIRFIKFKATAILVLSYVIATYASQMINMAIYGYWMPPISIILAFEKAGEALRSGQDSLISLIPTLVIILFISAVLIFNRFKKSKKTTVYSDIVIITLLLIQPIKIYSSPYSTLGENPNSRYSAIKAGYYANSYLIGRIIPDIILGRDYYKAYKAESPETSRTDKIKNIILVMGESLNTTNLSVFGYERETTPWLNEVNEKRQGVIKETYSNGVFTDITLPSFFNMIPTPNGDQQIASRKTNLFKMAKGNGYKTYFHSAQDNDGMSLMNKVGLEFIDEYTSSSALGYNNYTAAYDNELIDFLNDIDFSKSNFVVLHQIGSHSPYSKRVPDNFKPFGTENYRNDYDNTVLFTDNLLKNTMSKLKKIIPDDNWVFIFTSDHGQTVTDKTMGHGSLKLKSNYVVPGLIISDNKEIKKSYNEVFSECETIFHHQISTYIGRSLGFHVVIPDCNKGIVNGSRMNGSAGYLTIEY